MTSPAAQSKQHQQHEPKSTGMLTEGQLARLAHIAEDVTTHLNNLTDHYEDFVRVVKAEHRHLQEQGPYNLDEIIRQKTAIGQSLELAVTELFHCRQKLRQFVDRCAADARLRQPSAAARRETLTETSDDLFSDPFTLSKLYDLLVFCAGDQRDGSPMTAPARELQATLTETRRSLTQLLQVQQQSDQWIKLNAFVIEKMLEQHSQVIDLWQSVVESSENTYSDKGVKAKHSQKSILRAKA